MYPFHISRENPFEIEKIEPILEIMNCHCVIRIGLQHLSELFHLLFLCEHNAITDPDSARENQPFSFRGH